jgi:hypothetical protein
VVDVAVARHRQAIGLAAGLVEEAEVDDGGVAGADDEGRAGFGEGYALRAFEGRGRHAALPPSALPGISPARGEIGWAHCWVPRFLLDEFAYVTVLFRRAETACDLPP